MSKYTLRELATIQKGYIWSATTKSLDRAADCIEALARKVAENEGTSGDNWKSFVPDEYRTLIIPVDL